VFPLHTPVGEGCSCHLKAECEKVGKHPRTGYGIAHGLNDATTDTALIRWWWEAEWPQANVGIRTGQESGLVVLDVDPRHGGDASLRELEAQHGALPITPTALSGGGGRHFYFQHPGFRVPCGVLDAGLDIKGDGGSIVAPPSLHASGGQYKWIEGRTPTAVPLAPLPSWMLARLQEPRRPGTNGSTGHHRAWGIGEDGVIPEGRRNETLFRIACQLYRANLPDEMILEELLDWNMKYCAPPLQEAEVQQIVRSAARYNPGSEGNQEPLTDLGNARRFIAKHGHNLRYVPHWKKWLIWDGVRWAEDAINEITYLATETIRGLYGEVHRIEDHEKRTGFARHLVHSESHSRIVSMLKLAESVPGVAATPELLDADPWALNLLNGTLNLRTGQLREHRREDRITKLAPVAYDPEAQCPRWDAFLFRVLGGDTELIRFVQKAVGYTLTGSTEEQCFLILYGTGANGKSTLIQTLRALLSDYARQTPIETLLVKSGDGPRNDVARLHGARFVAAVEAESGKRLAEALVKQLTGGDTVTARFLYGEHFEFQPTFKLWLAVNHKPVVQGTDHAIWRRIRLLPFTVTIPEGEQDRQLAEKLQAELPGILRWAVEGCLLWQQEGLAVPLVVKQATSGYRSEMDVGAAFIAQCCVLEPQQTVSSGDLYTAYKAWCEDMGESPMSQKALADMLKERGCTRGRTRNGIVWYGIALREEAEVDTQTQV
jgi:putative DNA primase/helicase